MAKRQVLSTWGWFVRAFAGGFGVMFGVMSALAVAVCFYCAMLAGPLGFVRFGEVTIAPPSTNGVSTAWETSATECLPLAQTQPLYGNPAYQAPLTSAAACLPPRQTQPNQPYGNPAYPQPPVPGAQAFQNSPGPYPAYQAQVAELSSYQAATYAAPVNQAPTDSDEGPVIASPTNASPTNESATNESPTNESPTNESAPVDLPPATNAESVGCESA